MKKLLLSFSMILALGSAQAQNIFNFGFEGTTANMYTTLGWTGTNQSTPVYTGAPVWGIPTTAPTTTFAGGAQGGTAPSFALINYTSTGTSSTAGSGTISNWLISPIIVVENGDVVSFYTRIGRNAAAQFADNLELRYSTDGAFTVVPSTGATDLGSFTNLALAVNPNLDLVSYPTSWTQLSYTFTGLTGPTEVQLAFRYYVTDGGPAGANSDIIGIDTVSVDRPLSTDSFFSGNFTVSPNPTSDILKITNNTNVNVNSIEVTDMNGRVVKQVKGMVDQINVAELNAGVYFLKIASDKGTGTTKIIKK
ncbi:MAG: T9SS type A sorting domain-containing protein [Bacteroidetes bacterium]|nr:T9SS type A sorting domain-containing protein [Bacteroidota bacterium]